MPIADRASRAKAGPVDLVTLPTGIKDVVTFRGSIDTTPDFASGGELLQEWMVRCLDKGADGRDQFSIAADLENVGAQIGFSSSAGRVRYSGRCLASDLEMVLDLLFRQLCRPDFLEAESLKARDRIQASIQRGITEAGYRADVCLAQAIYPDTHPNALFAPAREAEMLGSFDPAKVSEYHKSILQHGTPRLVVVGAVTPERCVEAVRAATAGWNPGMQNAVSIDSPVRGAAGQHTVEIADRDNLEVRWGHALPFNRLDEDFLPSHLASYILGGNFSARLMNEVRDKQGLTYGVGSGLRGIDSRYSGMWRVNVTLSQDNLERGINATEEVVATFARSGVTADELAEKKTTIAGSYQVRLATTGGLGAALLQQMEDGRSLQQVDTYPQRIGAVSLESVNAAIKQHFHPDQLHRVVAGTLPE